MFVSLIRALSADITYTYDSFLCWSFHRPHSIKSALAGAGITQGISYSPLNLFHPDIK